MELIWIRHLQTPGNEKRQYIGSTDEPLSEKTVEGFLKNPAEYSEVERVICSPMLRCIQTAELMFPGTERKTFVVHGGTIMAVFEQLAEEKKNFYDWQVGNGSGYRVIIDEKEWKTGNKKLRKVEKLWD